MTPDGKRSENLGTALWGVHLNLLTWLKANKHDIVFNTYVQILVRSIPIDQINTINFLVTSLWLHILRQKGKKPRKSGKTCSKDFSFLE